MQAAYAAAGVDRFAAWVHETDVALQYDLEHFGYTLATTTRAMGMPLDDIRLPQSEIELRPLEWSDYLRVFDLPPGLLAEGPRDTLQLTVAWLDGDPVASGLAFDFAGDCGICNVGTLRFGEQSTPMAERVYAGVGFRDFGRFLEYVPAGHAHPDWNRRQVRRVGPVMTNYS